MHARTRLRQIKCSKPAPAGFSIRACASLEPLRNLYLPNGSGRIRTACGRMSNPEKRRIGLCDHQGISVQVRASQKDCSARLPTGRGSGAQRTSNTPGRIGMAMSRTNAHISARKAPACPAPEAICRPHSRRPRPRGGECTDAPAWRPDRYGPLPEHLPCFAIFPATAKPAHARSSSPVVVKTCGSSAEFVGAEQTDALAKAPSTPRRRLGSLTEIVSGSRNFTPVLNRIAETRCGASTARIALRFTRANCTATSTLSFRSLAVLASWRLGESGTMGLGKSFQNYALPSFYFRRIISRRSPRVNICPQISRKSQTCNRLRRPSPARLGNVLLGCQAPRSGVYRFYEAAHSAAEYGEH